MLNLTQVQAVSNEVLPPGKYVGFITDSQVKDTKSGGQMIQIELTITGPTQAKRKVWDTFNIKNDNPKAQEIGLGQLKNLCEIAGLASEKLSNFHPSMLTNLEVTFETTIEKNETYGDRAKVKKYIRKTVTANTQFEATQDQIPF